MGIPAELELLKHPEPDLRQRHSAPGKKHIRIAVGRDVRDCPMNSGIFYGSADQEIRVKVWEKEMKQKGV